MKRIAAALKRHWPEYLLYCGVASTAIPPMLFADSGLAIVSAFLYGVLILLSYKITQRTMFKDILGMAALIFFYLSISFSSLGFAQLTVFVFYIPILYAYVFSSIILPIVTVLPVTILFFSYRGGIVPDSAVYGTSISYLSAVVCYGIIFYLVRKLKLERKKYHALNSELEEKNKLLREISMKDGLTTVLNRRYFDQHYPLIWNEAIVEKTPISVLLIDIDYFKEYNDTYGHLAGDDCLKNIALALKEKLRKSDDWIVRYGGEEFCVVLPRTDEVEARIIGERLRDAVISLKIPHKLSKITHVVTVSIGCATGIPEDSAGYSNLLNAADQALYKAKRGGRNQFVSLQLPMLIPN